MKNKSREIIHKESPPLPLPSPPSPPSADWLRARTAPETLSVSLAGRDGALGDVCAAVVPGRGCRQVPGPARNGPRAAAGAGSGSPRRPRTGPAARAFSTRFSPRRKKGRSLEDWWLLLLLLLL